MSFLSAIFLIALPLVAVPVAIHLYRGRQRDVIMWGAMQFLAAAATKGRRMERLEELLLMLVRFAAVAVLVLALARPMVRSSLFGESAEREVILVLDNSLSMSREVDGESSAERMAAAAAEVVESLRSGDGVQILLAAGNEWASSEPIAADSAGKRRIIELVESVEPTLGTAELLESLQASVHLEADGEPTGRRVVVFTDGQATSFQKDDEAAWRQLEADLAARGKDQFPISVEVVECGSDALVENLAVAEVRAARQLVRPGEDAELTAEIRNTGDNAGKATEVEWLLGDKVVQKSPVTAIEPHATTQLTARVALPEAGHHTITCRIADSDQVPLDQESGIIIEVADQLPVLVVDSGGHRDAKVAAPVLIGAALGFPGSEPQPWHSVFRPEVVEPSALGTQPLGEYRAIVINNATDLPAETLERLDAYVRAGGGLWVALGSNTEPEAFNRDWYSDGEGLSPSAIETLQVVKNTEEDVAATIHPPSRDHPATMQLANTTQLDIDEARVRERWKFAAPSAAERAQLAAVLESGNGQPLVVEKYVGQGRVLVQSFPLGLEWSNLPLLKAYVVMVHDWLNHISAPTVGRYNLARGAAIVAAAPKASTGVKAALISPRGRKIPLSAAGDDAAPVFRYVQTRMPGMYRVKFDDDSQPLGDLAFHVARDASESDLRPLGDEDRMALLEPIGVAPPGGEPAESVRVASVPRRQPFWSVLLASLLALLVIELLMSNWLARRRSGLAVSTA